MAKLGSSLNERLANKIGDSKFKKFMFQVGDIGTGPGKTDFALKKAKQDVQATDRATAVDTAEAARIAELNKPPEMPIRDSAAEELAKKRSYASQRRRSGRVSTILSNNSDTLG